MIFKIEPDKNGDGWRLYCNGKDIEIWWGVFGTSNGRWSYVFPTLEELFERIKEKGGKNT